MLRIFCFFLGLRLLGGSLETNIGCTLGTNNACSRDSSALGQGIKKRDFADIITSTGGTTAVSYCICPGV